MAVGKRSLRSLELETPRKVLVYSPAAQLHPRLLEVKNNPAAHRVEVAVEADPRRRPRLSRMPTTTAPTRPAGATRRGRRVECASHLGAEKRLFLARA